MVGRGGVARARRVMVAAGTRREAIRLAPIVRALRVRPGLKVHLLAGDLTDEALRALRTFFGLVPETLVSLEADPAAAEAALAAVMAGARTELLIVQGNSATARAAARAAAGRGVIVALAEAGFPDEGPGHAIAREIERMAQLHFAPTPGARDAVLARGAAAAGVHVTGSTSIDALHRALEQLDAEPALAAALGVDRADVPLVLVVARRADTPLDAVTTAIRTLLATTDARFLVALDAAAAPDVDAHFADSPRVRVVGRTGFIDLVAALRGARVTMTDSPGIEEVAPALGVPVLVMRSSSERSEGIAAGCATLVGTGAPAIAAAAARLLAHPAAHAAMANARSPYGDGLAAWRIATIIRNRFADGAAAGGLADG